MSLLSLCDIYKYFEDAAVLKGINLDIKNGEFLTLLGPSGCGKTTILRLISGFITPTSGSIILGGEDIAKLPPEKRQVNTVFQNYALFPHMDIFNNVAFGLKMAKVPKAEIAPRVEAVLRMVGLEDYARRRPQQLSGGQQQRVAIARAIVNKPKILLLDEPFSALDLGLRKKMQRDLKHLQAKLGITFVFVTHDQEEAFAMSDRVVVMEQGTIQQIGEPKTIYEEPANLTVARFVGEINVLEAVITENTSKENHYTAMIEGEQMDLISRKDFAAGDEVSVLLRPEDFKIHRLADGVFTEPHFSGKIQETIYKGATVDLYIQLDEKNGGKVLIAAEFFNEDDDIVYNIGEKVAVTWINGWEVVLHAESE